MAGVNVIVSGGGTIVASVDGGDSVNVEVAGGIGPAAVVNTSGVIVGVNPVVPSGGTNITVSGSTAAYTINGPSDEYIAGLSPVQSIQGRGGNVVLVAEDITSGVFDVARIPVLPSQNQVISTGGISSVTPTQQENVAKGTIVTTVDGRRWVYSGAGDKTIESSYVELADITPDWTVIANKPTTFSPGTHTHSTANITGLTAAVKAFANVVSVQGRTGSVVLTLIDLSAANAVHTHSTTNISGFVAAAASAAPVQSVAGRSGVIALSTTDISGFTAAVQSFANVASVQGRTGSVVLTLVDLTAAAAVHTHSTASITGLTAAIQSFANVVSVQGRTGSVVLTLGDLTAAAAVHTHSTTEVSGLTATIQQYGKVLSVQGRTADVILSLSDLTAAAAVHSHVAAEILDLPAAVVAYSNTAADVSTASLTSVENNLPSSGDIVRVASPFPSSITGLSGGSSGVLKLIANVGAGDVTLKANDARSSEANRFESPSGDFLVRSGESISCWYDEQSSRWRIIERNLTAGEASLPIQAGNGGNVAVTDGTTASWVSRFSIVDPVLVAGANVSLSKNTNNGTIQIASSGGGGGSGASLSSDSPQPLGTASAGASGDASRSDHVHPLPPFPVSGINEATGAISIVAGGNVTVQTLGNTVTISAGNSLPVQGGNANRVVGTDGTAASWVTRYSVVNPVLVAGLNVSLTKNSANGTIQISATGGGGGGGTSIWPSIIFGG